MRSRENSKQTSDRVCSRRRFLETAAVLGSLSILGTAADAALIETRRLRMKSLEVHLARLPTRLDGFRLVQLSDLHYDLQFTTDLVETAVKATNRLNPDLVVLTGDYVSTFWSHIATAATAEPCALVLSGLRPRCGILAVLGNHDYKADHRVVTRSLRSRGITVLDNQSLPVESNGNRLWVAGVDDVLNGRPDLDHALRGIPRDEATILLVHEPDYADHAAHRPVDLQLSGHSHGGQVRIPFVGPPLLPPLARKYPAGLRWVGSLALNTNCGIGTSYLPVRLNCPPEITLLTLRSSRN